MSNLVEKFLQRDVVQNLRHYIGEYPSYHLVIIGVQLVENLFPVVVQYAVDIIPEFLIPVEEIIKLEVHIPGTGHQLGTTCLVISFGSFGNLFKRGVKNGPEIT